MCGSALHATPPPLLRTTSEHAHLNDIVDVDARLEEPLHLALIALPGRVQQLLLLHLSLSGSGAPATSERERQKGGVEVEKLSQS